MGANASERDQPFRGRIACRRGSLLVCVGVLLLLHAGCRSAGSRTSDHATTRLVEETPSKRNTVSPTETAADDEESSLTEKERVALAIKPSNPHAEKQPAQFTRPKYEIARKSSAHDDEDRDEDWDSSESDYGRRRLANATRDNRSKRDDSELRGELIQILSFEDRSQPDDSGSSKKKKKNPRRLPEISDEETGPSLRLKFPDELPGATTPNLDFPPSDDDRPDLTRRKMEAIDRMFPPPPTPRRLPAPSERPLTLEELEELALQNNPTLVQALASITMSQGTAIQAGVSPNPTFGYESDTVGSSFNRNYQGVFLSQPFKTAGKLGLQRAVANMDLMNSQLLYERTKLDVLRDVRNGFYNVQVAQESMKINEALVRFSNQVYEIMVKRLKNDEQAGYELSQLNSLVNQARGTFVASQNRYVSAWKQLAAAIGIPEFHPAPLEGQVDIPMPNLDYDALMDWVLNVHPDLHASRNLKTQSQLNLDLQRRIPIPDVTVAGAFQNDFTTPGFSRTSYNLNVSVPVPIFDRNQGNIRNAQGRYSQSSQQYAATKIDLTTQLADAFERYQSGRVQSEYYRTQILPDMARAYRGVYYRHIDDNEKVAFGDIIVAQQNLAVGIASYITLLLQQWTAAVDIANLVQLRDFRQMFPATASGISHLSDDSLPPTPREGAKP